MLLMLVSVRLNQIDRASGHAATTSIRITTGARKSQAVRARLFIGPCVEASPTGAADLVQLGVQLAHCGFAAEPAGKHVVRVVPDGLRDGRVLHAGGGG